MKSLAICFKGTEKICAQEIKEILASPSRIEEGCVIFEVKKTDDLAKFIYRCQSANRVLLLLDSFEVNAIGDFARIKKLNLTEYSGRTFAARCLLLKCDLEKQEVESAVGECIDLKVNLENPDITFYSYVYENMCYFGIDLSGDISKRDYKIQTFRSDIKGTLAYAAMRKSGFSGKGFLLDPFCTNGTLAIEAAFFSSGISPHFFSKEKFPFHHLFKIDLAKFDSDANPCEIYAFDRESGHISIARKNAKAAGVNVKFSALEPEWMGTKFGENQVKFIASNSPRFTQYNLNAVRKLYRDFFSQARSVLAGNGRISMLNNRTQPIKEIAEAEGFKLTESLDVEIGQETLKIMVFTKSFKKP